ATTRRRSASVPAATASRSPPLPARRDRPGDTLTMEREHPAARARRPRRTAMSTPDQPDRPDDRQPPPPAHETGEHPADETAPGPATHDAGTAPAPAAAPADGTAPAPG